MIYILSEKFFLFLRYFNLCPDFFGHVREWIGKKATVNSNICDIINYETTNYNTHLAQYFKK